MKPQAIAATGPNNFDFLRFFFASLVILSHSFPLGTGNEDAEPLLRFTNGQMTFGSLAVDCFFIISGFLISQSWKNRPAPRAFLEKRVRRIYPGFIVATLIGAFVITPLFSMHGASGITPEFVLRYAGRALRLLETVPSTAFETNPARDVINGSLWSISYEFWCYVGVMACGLMGLFRRPNWLAAGLAGAIGISFGFAFTRWTPGGSWLGVVFGYPPFWARLLPYFLVGMVFFAFRARVPLNNFGAAIAGAVFVAGAKLPHGMIFCLPLAAAYLIFWFAYLPVPRLHRFGQHGDYSYGIYLYAFPIQQMVVHAQGAVPMNPYALFAIAWPLSVAAGAASWWWVERRWVMGAKRPASADSTSPHRAAEPG